jgi:hypothetical protein
MFQVLHTMKLYATNTYGDYAMQVCLTPTFPLEASCTCAAPRLYQRARLFARHQRWRQSVCRGVFHPQGDGAAPRPRCAR